MIRIADFLTFQMLVSIGADNSFVYNCKFIWKSQLIYSLWKVATLLFFLDTLIQRWSIRQDVD
jgi:hypothetical protein